MASNSFGSMPAFPPISRNVAIAGGVVLLHVGAIWALQSGLLRRAAEVVIPVEILSQIITPPPAPQVAPPAPAPAPEPPKPKPLPRKVAPPPPAPRPVAAPSLPPAPNAPVGVVEPQPPAPPIAAPVAPPAPPAPPPAPPAPPAPPRIELPSSSADYLQNPQPPYPPMSKRLGEQGQVMLRVLIGADGAAQQVEIRRSSGFERLDGVARDTVRKWRFVPGKRNGVAEAMWFNVPINFVLE